MELIAAVKPTRVRLAEPGASASFHRRRPAARRLAERQHGGRQLEYVLLTFYIGFMDMASDFAQLEEQLRAQSELVQACARRAAAAGDPRLRSAWIDTVARLMNASAATGSVLAALKWAPQSALPALPVPLRLPKLPALPYMEGRPPFPHFR
jgi:hypothetical protein